ncbi:ABC transporter ATP-binding protein [Altibacter sp. HG106]|uniref:ABC transporter ATP-binding protein n=1 Tax=Altibacter sp. HG106 TaxID=3023937 RepID=UPI002350569D|nr:ABC transporter ATP-binding protein [Altibacter sp. HG106]MDC7994696.1 ABC transporter ATP-binding protein [Altibacter sp. HG106]
MIRAEGLSKRYAGADRFSVQLVDITVKPKEIFGLLGPNGAGKTTLISMLCTQLTPTSGWFEIAGERPSRSLRDLQQHIGMVPQEYSLYPSLTARENLLFFGSMNGVSGAVLRDRITSELESLGLTPFADKRIQTFSGGMKRRVNLIAGILHRPNVLFLDEPTVGVDVQSKQVILEKIRSLNAAGTTLVYTSHHLNEAEDLCSTIAIMDQGRMVCVGKPKQLIEKAKVANLEALFLLKTGKALRDYA